MMYEGLKGLLYGSQYRKFIDQEMGEIEKKYGLNRVDIQILFYLYRAGEHNCFKDIAEQKFFTKGLYFPVPEPSAANEACENTAGSGRQTLRAYFSGRES